MYDFRNFWWPWPLRDDLGVKKYFFLDVLDVLSNFPHFWKKNFFDDLDLCVMDHLDLTLTSKKYSLYVIRAWDGYFHQLLRQSDQRSRRSTVTNRHRHTHRGTSSINKIDRCTYESSTFGMIAAVGPNLNAMERPSSMRTIIIPWCLKVQMRLSAGTHVFLFINLF